MKGRNARREREVIGIVGSKSGMGCTHIACGIANYLFSVEKREVLYLEVGQTSQLYDMVQQHFTIYEGSVVYSYKGVRYLLSANLPEAEKIVQRYRGSIIVDFGTFCDAYQNLLVRCNRVLVMGSLLPWCRISYEQVIKEIKKGVKDMGQMNFFYSPSTDGAAEFCRRFRISLRYMPILGDPFAMKEKDVQILRNILYG